MSEMDTLVDLLWNNYQTLKDGGSLPEKCSPSPQETSNTSFMSSQPPKKVPKRDWTKRNHARAAPPVEMVCKKIGCGSTEIMEDVNEGFVVCTQCGMIQVMYVFEGAHTDAPYHGGVSPIAVHRYSRIVYLRGILKSLRGETTITYEEGEWEMIRSFFQKEGNTNLPHNSSSVCIAIKVLNMPVRLLHHATSIAWQLWQTHPPLPKEDEIRDVLRVFRALENVWDKEPLAGPIRRGRKKFLSYPLTWRWICSELGYSDLQNLMPGLSSQKLVARQEKILAAMMAKV
jgi:hypothetical protein